MGRTWDLLGSWVSWEQVRQFSHGPLAPSSQQRQQRPAACMSHHGQQRAAQASSGGTLPELCLPPPPPEGTKGEHNCPITFHLVSCVVWRFSGIGRALWGDGSTAEGVKAEPHHLKWGPGLGPYIQRLHSSCT